MSTARERMLTALEGGTPDVTPLSIYDFFVDDPKSDRWRPLFERGLGLSPHVGVVRYIEHGVTASSEERREGSDVFTVHRKQTPAGTQQMVRRNGWHHEDWIKSPADYKVMQWIVEHTELLPDYGAYARAEERLGDWGVPLVFAGRTPAMVINVDLAGTEQFCLDLAAEVPELFALYEAMRRQFVQATSLVAAGPGRHVKWLENLTISMLGPRWYRQLLGSVYEECVPRLARAGKRVMVHYDGALRVIADQIAAAPFHMIESLTEPPEGDMTYAECRAAWPDKLFWANINVDWYYRPPEVLACEVAAKRQRAGKRGLLFEVSEDLPRNWSESLPVVLDALEQLR